MKAIRERRRAHRAAISFLALLAAALLLAGGCGSLNDDSGSGQISVTMQFNDGSGGSSSSSGEPSNSPQLSTPSGDEVCSIVVGAIAITHEKNIGGGIQPYTAADIASLDDRQRDLLEKDAEQSVTFLEIVQLPFTGDTVDFSIPPDNAGNWQLFAVGMRHRIEALDDIRNNSPIWYGFIDQFLNGVVTPENNFVGTLALSPACGLTTGPAGAGCPLLPLSQQTFCP